MRFLYLSHLFLACGVLSAAGDVAPPVDPIRLPVVPVPAPAPSPPPTPAAVTSLAGDQLYVIDSDVDCTVLASPAGVVGVSEEAGPVKIRGKFVDGNGKAETRTYKGKTIFSVEPLGSGRVELLIVPASGSQAKLIRRTLDVGGGPAPTPPTPPAPSPTPTALWGFVVVEDTAEGVAARGAMLTDPTLAAYLKAQGYHWRVVDKGVTGPDGKPPADVLPALTAAMGKTSPQFFVVDSKGTLLGQQNLPTAAGIVSALKMYGGK